MQGASITLQTLLKYFYTVDDGLNESIVMSRLLQQRGALKDPPKINSFLHELLIQEMH